MEPFASRNRNSGLTRASPSRAFRIERVCPSPLRPNLLETVGNGFASLPMRLRGTLRGCSASQKAFRCAAFRNFFPPLGQNVFPQPHPQTSFGLIVPPSEELVPTYK